MDAAAFTTAAKAEVAKHDARVPEQRAGDEFDSGLANYAAIHGELSQHIGRIRFDSIACSCETYWPSWEAHRRHVARRLAMALADHRGREAG